MHLLALALVCLPAQDDLTCLEGEGLSLFKAYLLRQITAQSDDRRGAVEKALTSREKLEAYARTTRDAYRKLLGPFPEKTPLNAKVVGTLEGDDCRIEKVVFESRPRHYVTANFYVPKKGTPPFPGVAVACGHSSQGKAYEAYQSACVLLAKNGFAVLIYDPFGQGERRQLRGRAHENSGVQHKLCNVNALPVGLSGTHYQTWDSIRALDYLLSRPEVDASKPVGMTGNSGGGAQTIHAMVLDDRIGPAAPSCHVTTMEQEYTRWATSDGCQIAPSTGAISVDHPDFFTMRAPKPTIILCAEKDYKDIRFTRKTFLEARTVYGRLGASDRVDLFAFNDRHAFSKPRREAATRWMRRWLLDDPAPVAEPELKLQPPKALAVTRSGETWKEFGNMRTIPELNLARAESLAKTRRVSFDAIPSLLGLRKRASAPRTVLRGSITRQGYRIEKQIITRPGDVPLPALLFIPDDPEGRDATIHLDGRGKSENETVLRLVKQGRRVLSLDARGWGETRGPEGRARHNKGEHDVAMVALHLGRPLPGQRVEDVLTAADALLARDDVDAVHLLGVGAGGPVALHAAAVDSRIATVVERDSIESWLKDVVAQPLRPDAIGLAVPGALLHYDLPDLRKHLGSRLRAASK